MREALRIRGSRRPPRRREPIPDQIEVGTKDRCYDDDDNEHGEAIGGSEGDGIAQEETEEGAPERRGEVRPSDADREASGRCGEHILNGE